MSESNSRLRHEILNQTGHISAPSSESTSTASPPTHTHHQHSDSNSREKPYIPFLPDTRPPREVKI
eukprot:TRINITY_DN431_c0_g1_i1.p1 TRINITY_DN431_c0_g1~~TRINITY_DN431_c0_g1_i1.p1  ORF type:complete len:66 (+),score=0.81 TRINITY_DN431_c0_g1_i1:310-507(+)